MGLPTSTDESVEDLPKRFSDDILRIELSGPEHHHLSVVDVPGLFHSKLEASKGRLAGLTACRPYQVPDARGSEHHSNASGAIHDRQTYHHLV